MAERYWSVTAGRMSGTIQAPTARAAAAAFPRLFPPSEYGSLYVGPAVARPASSSAIAAGYYVASQIRSLRGT